MKICNDILKFIYGVKATYVEAVNSKNKYNEDCGNVANECLEGCFSYHFALLLKSIFKRGIIVWCAPHYGHFAFLDIDGTAYNINGIYTHKVAYFIPEEYVDPEIINDVKFVVQYPKPVSFEKIRNMIKAYCINTHTMYDENKVNQILTDYRYIEYDDSDVPPNYWGEFNEYCINVNDYKED